MTGEFLTAIEYIKEHPVYINYLLVYGLVSVAGITCIYIVVVRFGALVNSTVTTTRKFLSILFSIYAFGHSCTPLQYSTILITFLAVIYNLYSEHSKDNPSSVKTHTS